MDEKHIKTCTKCNRPEYKWDLFYINGKRLCIDCYKKELEKSRKEKHD